MTEGLLFGGFVASMIMAWFARLDQSAAEMRTHLILSVLFLSLFLEKVV